MSDVLVVGAGPVGLTMAAELARHGVAARWGGGAWLVRPDGYVGWRGPSLAHPGLRAHLDRVAGRS